MEITKLLMIELQSIADDPEFAFDIGKEIPTIQDVLNNPNILRVLLADTEHDIKILLEDNMDIGDMLIIKKNIKQLLK